MTDPIRFYEKDRPYYEFTNFAPFAIVMDGGSWPTNEHFYQAQKFADVGHREQIRKAHGPRAALDLAHRLDGKRPGWPDRRLEIMKLAVLAKFTQHSELRQLLLETGDAQLIEASPSDAFWGEGPNGDGHNHLGVLLMEVREILGGGAPRASSAPVEPTVESPLPADVSTRRIDVVASRYQGAGRLGDFRWMLQQPEFDDALFIFNDNEEQFDSHRRHGPTGRCPPGAGAATIRPEQCKPHPRAAGIPTGAGSKGYRSLDPHTRSIIDAAFSTIEALLATGRFSRVVYSADADGRLGFAIFTPGRDVIDYITTRLRSLARP